MIVSCERVWSGETWSDGKGGAREYEEHWQLISDNPNESQLTVRMHSELPPVGQPYADDMAALCSGRNANRDGDTRLKWMVVATFEFDPNNLNQSTNPLAEPVKVRWTSAIRMKAIIKDLDGTGVVSTAGEYFDPPPEVEVPIWVANIQFNVSAVPVWIGRYRGAVNDNAISIKGYPVATERARITGIDISEEQVESDVSFYTVTIAVEVRDPDDDDFDLSCLNQGLWRKNRITGRRERCRVWQPGGTDFDNSDDPSLGEFVDSPGPMQLDASGFQIESPTVSTAVFLDFNTTRKLQFGDIIPGIT